MQQDQSSLGAVLAALFAWVMSPAGQQWVAGGAGGLVRWALVGRATSRGRWALAGLAYVIAGGVMQHYGAQTTLWAIRLVTGDLGPPGDDPGEMATAAFWAGVLGVAFVRIVIAAFDRRAPQLIDQAMGGDHGNG